MTSKRSNTWSKTFEQEQHKLILRTDGRFNLLWCDTVFDFFFPLSFFFSSIVCFSSRTVKSERNGNSYGDINIICIVKFFKQNWVYRSLWTMKKQTTISFALVFLCVAGKCRSSAQIHGWNHPSLFHTEISIFWDILINMSKWLLFYTVSHYIRLTVSVFHQELGVVHKYSKTKFSLYKRLFVFCFNNFQCHERSP